VGRKERKLSERGKHRKDSHHLVKAGALVSFGGEGAKPSRERNSEKRGEGEI